MHPGPRAPCSPSSSPASRTSPPNAARKPSAATRPAGARSSKTSNAMSASANAALKIGEAAPLFAALGDETRLKLVSRLCSEGPLSIVRLSEGTDVTRQAITKHLRALADAGLVHDTR